MTTPEPRTAPEIDPEILALPDDLLLDCMSDCPNWNHESCRPYWEEARRRLAAQSADSVTVDRCARAAFDAFYCEGTPYSAIEQAIFTTVAEAVIAAMGQEPGEA